MVCSQQGSEDCSQQRSVCAIKCLQNELPTLLERRRHWVDKQGQSVRQLEALLTECGLNDPKPKCRLQAQEEYEQSKKEWLEVEKPHKSKDSKATQPIIQRARPLFRDLGENEKIEDYFLLGTSIYEVLPDNEVLPDKVLNAKRRNVGKGEMADCVVKIQRKRRPGCTRLEEIRWRAVMSQLFASNVSPHVLKVHEIFEDEKNFYIIMEKCSGGELHDFLLAADEVSINECKRIIRSILNALNELHSRGLIHGDVKPENIMFSDSERQTLKLIDFDTCQKWNPDQPTAERFCGTPGFIAPETLRGNACPQSDLWSVGVILFTLMTGSMPWDQDINNSYVDSRSAKVAYANLLHESIDWKEAPWQKFPVAAELCQQLLKFDPLDRVNSASEALNHRWLRDPKLK